MIIKAVEAGPIQANCYILMDEETKEIVIMDPGGEAEMLSEEIDNFKGNVKFIILTHGHFDHVGAVKDLCQKYKVPFYISAVDYEYVQKDDSGIFGKLPNNPLVIKEGDTISFGKNTIKVLETPGHTKGGVSFVIDDKVFTGDTLFRGSIGRTDFLGGDFDEIINSIKTKLLPLGDDIIVYPGHGPSSTIAFEKRNNPYLD